MAADGGLIQPLQGLRGVCYIMIFVGHVQFLWGWPALGVTVFFVMSGFLLMLRHGGTARPPGCGLQFAAGRLGRIYPLYVLTVLAMLLLLLVEKGDAFCQAGTWLSVFLDLLLLQAWVPDRSVALSLNSVGWYLSAAFFLYACFPRLSGLVERLKDRQLLEGLVAVVLLQLVLAAAICMVSCGREEPQEFFVWGTYIFPIFRLGDFAAGCLAGCWSGRRLCQLRQIAERQYRVLHAVTTAILGLVAAVTLNLAQSPAGWQMVLHNWSTPFVLPAVLLVLLAALDRGLMAYLLGSRLLAGLGNLSGSCYLIHFVVIRYGSSLATAAGWQQDGVLVAGAEFVLTCFLAAAYQRVAKGVF